MVPWKCLKLLYSSKDNMLDRQSVKETDAFEIFNSWNDWKIFDYQKFGEAGRTLYGEDPVFYMGTW